MEQQSADPKESETQPNNAIEAAIARRVKAPSLYDLPSERWPLDVHFAVLRRMMNASSNGATAVTISTIEGGNLPVQSAVLNARFMAKTGLLEFVARGSYKPTPSAVRLMMAQSVNHDRARPILKEIIEGQWFSDTAKIALSTRPKMPEQEFLEELGIKAQTDFSKKKDALAVILEYLVYAGIVVRGEDGSLSLGNGSAVATPASGPTEATQAPDGASAPSPAAFDPVPTLAGIPTVLPAGASKWENISTNDFSLRVRSTRDALADLRAHLEILERKITRETPSASGTSQ